MKIGVVQITFISKQHSAYVKFVHNRYFAQHSTPSRARLVDAFDPCSQSYLFLFATSTVSTKNFQSQNFRSLCIHTVEV